MRVAVKCCKRQKRLEKFDLHLSNTLTTPPLYDRAYPEMLSTASPVGVTKLYNRTKIDWEYRQVLRKLILRQLLAENPREQLLGV